MTAKKKRDTSKGKKINQAPRTGSKPGRTVVKKKNAILTKAKDAMPMKDEPVEVREVLIEMRSDSKNRVELDILKKEGHHAVDRAFEIHVLKDKKRRTLLFYVYELTAAGALLLPELKMELRMPDTAVIPELVPGYDDIIKVVKGSIETFADSTVNKVKKFLWSQFGASIDMLLNAIRQWPDSEWKADKRFFYIAYHTLVFLDYYLADPEIKFSPELSFTLTDPEEAPVESLDDVIPDRIYSKTELLDYGELLRYKCRSIISLLDNDRIGVRWIEKDGDMNYGRLEILLYNMRHVQHHAAQLNMLLRLKVGKAPKWIGRVTDELS